MSDYRKNFLVGLTMLLGLALLAVMIILFDKAPARWIAPNRLAVTFEANRADGLSGGSGVSYLGVPAGVIESVERDPKNPTRVWIHTLIDAKPPLPGNLVGKVHRQSVVGGGSLLDLEFQGDKPIGQLDAGKLYHADYVGEGLIPPEITQLAAELRGIAQSLRDNHFVENTNQMIVNTNQMVVEFNADAKRLGKLIDSANETLNDPKMKQDIKAALANIHTATDHAVQISADLEKISGDLSKKVDDVSSHASAALLHAQNDMDSVTGKINDRLEQTAKLLETFQSIAAKIDKGEGTAGMLVNDPKLYQSMTAAMQELKATVADLKLLVDQWTQEGVHIH